MDYYNIDDIEFAKIVERRIATMEKNKNVATDAKAYLLGGQPGAGKSVMSNKLNVDDKFIIINGDQYLKLHPKYQETFTKSGDDTIGILRPFANKITEKLIDKLSNHHYNLIIEGTLRTTEVPLKTKAILENKGYTVALSVIVTRPEISFLSTQKRYFEMLQAGTMPRKTPIEHHQLVVKSIIDNLDQLYKTGQFNDIMLFDRQRKLYTMQDTPNINPAHLMKAEFVRALNENEIFSMHKTYARFMENNNVIEDYFPELALTISPAKLKEPEMIYKELAKLHNDSQYLDQKILKNLLYADVSEDRIYKVMQYSSNIKGTALEKRQPIKKMINSIARQHYKIGKLLQKENER